MLELLRKGHLMKVKKCIEAISVLRKEFQEAFSY